MELQPHYVDFLKTKIRSLSIEYKDGKVVETNSKLRYITVKKSPRRNGNIIVYRISSAAIRIVHIFGTAQDWQSKVKPKSKKLDGINIP